MRCGMMRAFSGDPGAKVTAGDDDRHPPGYVSETVLGQPATLLVRKHELLRVIRQDANTVDALIDHAVEDAPIALVVDVLIVVKWRRRNWEKAAIDTCDRHELASWM